MENKKKIIKKNIEKQTKMKGVVDGNFGLGIAAASFFAFLIVLFKQNFQQKRYSGKPDHAAS